MNAWKFTAMAALIGVAAGCAQNVPDIDRTQPNALEKADFTEGIWYMRETVTDVPPTVSGIFVGIASSMEKVRFEVQEDYLIAYRAYEPIPGLDEEAGEIIDGEQQYEEGFEEGREPDEYKEAPIAVFPIISHFDIERSYNTATGEQSNVIVENGTDRPWFERKYFRVAWEAADTDLSFPSFTDFYVQDNEGTQEAWYEEREEDELNYFDYTSKYAFRGAGDIEVVTSFARTPAEGRDYEPAFYDDYMMSKFGYFRTERLTYDRGYGFTDSGVIYLAQRHDIWENDFKRDTNGDYLRDADGRRIPTPMAQRTPKPVVYYLSLNYPEALLPGAQGVADDWDRAFTRAAAAAKGMTPEALNEEFGPMFVLCSNPVQEDDHAACDPRSDELKEAQDNAPYVARHGDVRNSFIFWVEQDQPSGPLGYGPSYDDPETGELVSGTAYVYGAGVDAYAASGVDIVRLVNGDFTEEQIRNGDDRIARIIEQREHAVDPRGRYGSDQFDNIPTGTPTNGGSNMLPQHIKDKLETVRQEGLGELEGRIGKQQRIRDALKESGFDQLLLDDEYVRAMSGGKLQLDDMTSDEMKTFMDEHNPLDIHEELEAERARFEKYAKHNVYLNEFADEAVIGTALEFKGQDDYDKIWNELRNRIFRGVMAHEVGHTIGLRHNFQGSWDSINFFDEYWEMRKENFFVPTGLDEFYEANSLTQAQVDGDITRYQYSTIMDYHSRFNGDTSGIGKYDEAAIIFAYTFGTYDDIEASNEEPILAKPGYVEVFEDVAEEGVLNGQPVDTKSFLHSYDRRYAATQHPLEDFHYSTIVEIMGGPDALKERSLVPYSELRQRQLDEDETRPMEVQYMFCSDEWRGAAISCDTWDLGADPFEKVQWAIKKYEEYYPLTHFRRDRLEFGVYNVLGRAFREYGVMPRVYQRWFFNQYYSQDDTLSTYFLLAAYSGFNWLGQQMSTPSYGAYQFDADRNSYRLVSYNPDYADADLSIDYGEGKTFYSDYANDGYYFFYRITEVGTYWERLVASELLASSSSVAVLGTDTTADFRSYLLPYYLTFDQELTSLFNGIYLNDQAEFAPTVTTGTNEFAMPTYAPLYSNGQPFNPLNGQPLTEVADAPNIEIPTTWSGRVNSMLTGLSAFSSSYSPAYIDQARVWRLGAGNGLTTPEILCQQQGLGEECESSSHELVTFTDTNSGVTYAAIAEKNLAEDDQSLAARMVLEGAFYQSLLGDERYDQNSVRGALANHGEDMALLIDAVDRLGRIF